MSDHTVDLRLDFNAEDETGLPWTYLGDADRSRIISGGYVIAGAGGAMAVAHVGDVADDGLVRVKPVRGTVEANRHLLDAAPTGT